MFSLFSLKRFCSLGAFMLCAALVFVGCPTEAEEDPFKPLIGEGTTLPADFYGSTTATWSSTPGDSYQFAATTLEYTGSYKGTVKYIGYFTEDKKSGVIIYEYLSGQEQKYYDFDENWNPIGDPVYGPGKFHATYFFELTATTVKLGGAYDSEAPHGCEAATLDAAKTKFASLDASQKYCSSGGGAYTKQ